MIGVDGKGESLDVAPAVPDHRAARRPACVVRRPARDATTCRPSSHRYLAGEIDVDAFVSHKLSLDEVNRGFELMEAGDGIRSVIDFA